MDTICTVTATVALGAVIALLRLAFLSGASTLCEFILVLAAWRHGYTNIVWTRDPDVAKRVIMASKRKPIEVERSLQRWAPLMAMEMEDAPMRDAMHANLNKIIRTLAPLPKLYDVFQTKAVACLSAGRVITADVSVEIIVASFYEWLFERPFNLNDLPILQDGTMAFRLALSLQKLDQTVVNQRHAVVSWFLREVQSCDKLYSLFQDDWVKPEIYSLVIQPFFVTPAINVVQIGLGVCNIWRSGLSSSSISDKNQSTAWAIEQAIDKEHPFPSIERYMEHGLPECGIAKDTLVFIDMSKMQMNETLRFGVGPRRCPGRAMAMLAMEGFFCKQVLDSPLFQPHKGYSGSIIHPALTFEPLRVKCYVISKLMYELVASV
ncbi:Aste57867_15560 [Aphanomyces stellatus]|uniref:Aste57867_15560 protein n=1 Tax=Aphanomyces stellatus TaxID=120398 RepID=A0A485L6D1_9STRA|nr:hypothetical protein As57867_015504 [Aphanomyces stellatus]VFT92362.1 Aste57867_15560 [Aphanomyces stellatus]